MNTRRLPPQGLFLGAALMYLFDPDRGHRRRTMISAKARKLRRTSGRALQVATHDLANRARGAFARVGAGLEHDVVSDQLLEARIRSRIGRVCSHPHAIQVVVNDGIATVTGPVLLTEWRRLRRTIKDTRDLKEFDDRLEIRTVADINRLKGGRQRVRTVPELLEGTWSPAMRLVVGSVGVGAALTSIALHGWGRRIALGVGLGLLGNAVDREIRAHPQSSEPNGWAHEEIPAGYDELEEATGEYEYIS